MKTESIFPIIFGGSDANRSKAKPISSILVDRVVESPCIESAGRVSQVKLKKVKNFIIISLHVPVFSLIASTYT